MSEGGGFVLSKITNNHWLGLLAPTIKQFQEKINIPTITYETLFTYFAQGVQFGGDRVEFNVVHKELKPYAFAHWMTRGLPHIGVAHCDFIYSWNRAREPIGMLIDGFREFGKRNRCTYYEADVINEAIFRVFRKAAAKRGFELEKTGIINFLGRNKQ
jgi:hypothetical protein